MELEEVCGVKLSRSSLLIHVWLSEEKGVVKASALGHLFNINTFH